MIRFVLGAVLAALAAPAEAAPEPPRINGPKVFGIRPGRPFLFRIPATGARPMKFAVKNLPRGLAVDPATGIVSGRIASSGATTYKTTVTAKNADGQAEREFHIVVGDKIALTPPMGWNHWYTHYDHITDALMREAADVMLSSGMADAGYAYVNIDDCWMVRAGSGEPRDAQGRINPNGNFPDMKALTDYIHAKGLKAGIYSSPGPRTCAGFTGSYEHEEQDARRIAEWGFDFFKYDWCSYGDLVAGKSGSFLERHQGPYRQMGDLLKKQNRDIVLNICQYGREQVWTWGAAVGGHCWRTTYDLGLEDRTRLPSFYSIGFKNAKYAKFAGPGGWNDPDYILIGWVGNAHDYNAPPHLAPLTADEQKSYMSMWCLMASPLFYSGLMAKLDAATLEILCNTEAIEVDQDPLGRQAQIIRQSETDFVLAKPMEDGSMALGLFNLGEAPRAMAASWAELGLAGRRAVRDLWGRKELGAAEGKFEAQVPAHGVSLVRLRSGK